MCMARKPKWDHEAHTTFSKRILSQMLIVTGAIVHTCVELLTNSQGVAIVTIKDQLND